METESAKLMVQNDGSSSEVFVEFKGLQPFFVLLRTLFRAVLLTWVAVQHHSKSFISFVCQIVAAKIPTTI